MKWKLNRLFMPYAWRQAVEPLVGVIAVAVSVECLFNCWEDASEILVSFCLYIVLPLAGIAILCCICAPHECFVLNNGNTRISIYDEKKNGKIVYLISVKNGDECTEFYAEDYDFPYKMADAKFFIYRPLGQELWYRWEKDEITQYLGCHINKILFIEKGKKKVNFLNNNGVMTISAKSLDDVILPSDVHLPELTRIFSLHKEIQGQPEEYIFIKVDGRYLCYGFYLQSDRPYYRKLAVSSAILRRGNERIILVWNDKKRKYKEICRKKVITRQLNSYMVELSSSAPSDATKVTVWYFDGIKCQLSQVYDGNPSSIDFDTGEVCDQEGNCHGKKRNQ